MHFDNLKAVLRAGADVPSRFKLATAAAVTSRPWLGPFGLPILRFLSARDGCWVRYRSETAVWRFALRVPDLSSDLQTFYETGSNDSYRLPRDFEPEVVVDGGANVGLFTLRALGRWPGCRVIACEPDPRNLKQLRLHFQENRVTADIVAACLGGRRGTVRFYCRKANQGSFDATLPFASITEVPVLTLAEVCQGVEDRRCLVKLDVEGAEVEVLRVFLSTPRPNYVVVGELHDRKAQKQVLADLMRDSGWQIDFFSEAHECVLFHAKPAAGAPRVKVEVAGISQSQAD